MIRAAAKNHDAVTVVVDAEDYAEVLAEMAATRRRHQPGAAQGAGRQGLRAHRRLRRGHRATGSPATLGERAPRLARVRRPAGAGRCATARTRTSGPPSTSTGERRARRGDGRAAPGQGALLQQPRRHRRGPRAGGRVRSAARRRSPSSSTPTRAASRSAPTLAEAYAKASRCDPVSAFGGIVALNRRIDAATAGEITEIFTEVVDRARRQRRGQGDLRREEEPAPADHRRPARSARAGPHLPLARRRLPGAVARQRRGRGPRAEGRDQAAADRRRSWPTCSSPSGSPSTSSRTPSSTPRTAPPSASAPAR